MLRFTILRLRLNGFPIHQCCPCTYATAAVTSPGIADRALGTYPDPQTVPTSPTARNLFPGG